MPDARLTISIDDAEARITLARLQSDVERTASLIEASSRRVGSLAPGLAGAGGVPLLAPAAEAQRTAGQIASQLGVQRAQVLEAFRSSQLLATPLVPGVPGAPGRPGGGLDLTAHAGGLQAVAHGVRSVADSYAYRVSPALA